MSIFCIVIALILHTFAFGATLHEVLQVAKEKNHSLQREQNKESILQKQRYLSKQKRYGTLTGSASIKKYNSSRTLAPLAPPIEPSVTKSKEIAGAGLRYNVTLFDGSYQKMQFELSDIAHQSAKLLSVLKKAHIEYNIKVLYTQILSLRAKLLSQKQYQSSLQTLAKEIELRINQGVGARIDLLKVEVDIEKSTSAICELESNIKILAHSLNTFAGQSFDPFTFQKPQFDAFDNYDDIDIDQVASLKLTQLAQKKSLKEYQKVRSTYYPKITAYTLLNRSFGAGESDDIAEGGIEIQYTLWDFGQRDARLEIAQIEKINAQLQYAEEKHTLVQKIQATQEKIRRAQSNHQAAQAQLQLALKIEKIEKIKFEQELKSINDYIEAKTKTTLTKSNAIASFYEIYEHKAYLDYLYSQRKN